MTENDADGAYDVDMFPVAYITNRSINRCAVAAGFDIVSLNIMANILLLFLFVGALLRLGTA